MFFQVDLQGDKGNGILSITRACADLGVAVPAVVVYQKLGDYCFEFHTGMHGEAGIYVNHANRGDRIKKNVPEITLGDTPKWLRGESEFSSKSGKEALKIVTDNIDLFQDLWDAWNAPMRIEQELNELEQDDRPENVFANTGGHGGPGGTGGPPPMKRMPISAPSANPHNVQGDKKYVFNETGNIMVATTITDSETMSAAAQAVFAEVSVFFAAMTRAMSTTINPRTGKMYSVYDYEALQGIIDGSGLFVHVTEEDVEHSSSKWGISFSKELVEALLGLATGTGELAFAKAMVASMGAHALKIGYEGSSSDGKVANIVFVCEYIFGMPLVSAIVVYLDSVEHYQQLAIGPCIQEHSGSINLKMHKDTYLFVTPKFIKEYSGDLLSAETDLDFLEFVDFLQDLVERKAIITAVETLNGDPAPATLTANETYAMLGAFLVPENAKKDGITMSLEFTDPAVTGAHATVVTGEMQANVVNFSVTGTSTKASPIGIYASKTDPHTHKVTKTLVAATPVSFIVG